MENDILIHLPLGYTALSLQFILSQLYACIRDKWEEGQRHTCFLTTRSCRKASVSWTESFTYLPMYFAYYWRIPLEGTPQNSDRVELLDLHDVNNKHGNTQRGYCLINFEITAEKVSDMGNCRLLACCQNLISEDVHNQRFKQTQDTRGKSLCAHKRIVKSKYIFARRGDLGDLWKRPVQMSFTLGWDPITMPARPPLNWSS